jgi:hypothetical protein
MTVATMRKVETLELSAESKRKEANLESGVGLIYYRCCGHLRWGWFYMRW